MILMKKTIANNKIDKKEVKKLLASHRLYPEIRKIGQVADKTGMNVFLVGGFVRDLLMGYENFDLDVVVEGGAEKVGQMLKRKIGGTLAVYHKFGTVSLVIKKRSLKIDIARARKEKYKKPADLPAVSFSSLKDDLFRRDFTINAMAICVNKEDLGIFVDHYRGMDDLRKGIIRSLHDKSFIDDPTRIFRAVRFEQRFGFKIENRTMASLKQAVIKGMFAETSEQRIRDEIILLLKEPRTWRVVSRMRSLHGLSFIHRGLGAGRTPVKAFKNAEYHIKWYIDKVNSDDIELWIVNLLIMTGSLENVEIKEVMSKYFFTNAVKNKVESFREHRDPCRKKLASKKRLAPSSVYKSLGPLSCEGILCIMAIADNVIVTRRCRKYLTVYRYIKVSINGHDVKRAGMRPGPGIKNVLDEVLFAKLDGRVSGKRSQIKYMKELVGKSSR